MMFHMAGKVEVNYHKTYHFHYCSPTKAFVSPSNVTQSDSLSAFQPQLTCLKNDSISFSVCPLDRYYHTTAWRWIYHEAWLSRLITRKLGRMHTHRFRTVACLGAHIYEGPRPMRYCG